MASLYAARDFRVNVPERIRAREDAVGSARAAEEGVALGQEVAIGLQVRLAGLVSARGGGGGPAPRKRDHVRFMLGPVVQGGGIEIGTVWPHERVNFAVK